MVSMLALATLDAVLMFSTVRDACHDTQNWANVNIPISPATASTEVVKGDVAFLAGRYAGSVLYLRNGQRQVANIESTEFLRALGITSKTPPSRGDVWRLDPGRAVPQSYVVVRCFSVQ